MKICYLFGHSFDENSTRYYNNCKICDESFSYKWSETFWESDFVEYAKIALGYIAIVALFVGTMLTISAVAEKNICTQYTKMGYETFYNFFLGCMIKHPEFGWLPREKFFEVLQIILK